MKSLTKRRPFVLLAILILLVATAGLAVAMMQPGPAELLTGALETMEAVTDGHAVIDVTADLPEAALTATLEVWGRLPQEPDGRPGLRLEVLDASESAWNGLTAVTDGHTFWLYDPARQTVITGETDEMAAAVASYLGDKAATHQEGPWDDAAEREAWSPPETAAEAVDRLLTYFDAERRGSETMAGTGAQLLRLVPIPEQMPDEVRAAGGYLEVWLRTGDQLPVGVAYTGGSMGSGRATASLAETNVGLDDALFTFEIPAGATVRQAVDLLPQPVTPDSQADLLTPTVLPAAARPGEVVQIRGATVQRWQLPEGRSFSVAQGPVLDVAPPDAAAEEAVTVRGVSGLLFSDETGQRSLLTWREGERTFWVGGDLTPAEALSVAESLR